MHSDTQKLFRQAIVDSLPHLQPLESEVLEQHQVWKKSSDTSWEGTQQYRTDVRKVLRKARKQVEDSSAAFCDSFSKHHPEYNGIIGFGQQTSNWSAKRRSHIVESALHKLWWRHKTFGLDDTHINTIVQEFADFIDNDYVRLRYQAPLINFKMPADSLAFPDGLTIRRLNEEEVSYFYGNSFSPFGFRGLSLRFISEFVLEGELDQLKTCGDTHPQSEDMGTRAKSVLNKAVLALRTFKGGMVGYDWAYFSPMTFCPIGFFNTQGIGDAYIPSGSYVVEQTEYESLARHAELIFAYSEPVMEMACSRLADAENRIRAEDRVIDAVIGMEALLLASIRERSELSFRFSLHYAMLFPKPERQNAFCVARDLYNLRSKIAHGSHQSSREVKIGGEKQSLDKAGKQATDALRTIVMSFLPDLPEKGPQYKNHDFWQQAYLGLSD